MSDSFNTRNPYDRRGDRRFVFGIIVAGFGVLFLLQMLHFGEPFRQLVHGEWPFILIIIGVLLGFKSKFRNNGWWLLTIIGVVNLIDIFPVFNGIYSNQLIWPLLLIGAGISIITSRRGRQRQQWKHNNMGTFTTSESNVHIDVTFGGRKEIITSKEFRGGTISATFGGAELNLMQADSTIQPMTLQVNVSFGGVEIIVPSHWEIVNQIGPSFGSVEDHRTFRGMPDPGQEKRTLIITGSCSFGSVEIKSY